MAKVTKKKKEKHADFTKAKLKLGKGKKAPSNATNTSFKARSIALPGQDVLNRALATTSTEPTTSQGLVLDEVILRFRHPNAGVRKESLGGLKEIVAVAPERQVGKVVRAVGGMVSDEDGAVRKALLGFLAWYLPLLPMATLSPHIPVLLLQTSSALSHIFPDIRLDACKLVHLLLQHVPDHVIGDWPRGDSNILDGLRLALGLGEERGGNRLGAGGRLVVSRTVLAFVSAALRDGEDDTGKGSFWGWLDDGGAKIKIRERGNGKERAVGKPETGVEMVEEGYLVGIGEWGVRDDRAAEWGLGRLGGGVATGDETSGTDVVSQLYLQLHPLLLSTFLESAPIAFPPSHTSNPSNVSEDTPLCLCLATTSLTEVLAKHVFSNASSSTAAIEVRSSVSDFLRRMAPYFPFRPARTASSSTGLSPAFSLSLSYANLGIFLAPRPPLLSFPRGIRRDLGWRGRIKAVEQAWTGMREQARKAQGKGKAGGADGWALEEVADWVIETMSPSTDALAIPLTSTAYAALLPIISQLLVQPPPPARSAATDSTLDIPASVGCAFLAHLARQGSSSTTKSLGDQFVISLIEAHEARHPQYPCFVPINFPLREQLKAWFAGLPKTLWELVNRDERASERLLTFLLDIGLRGKAGLESPYSLIPASVFPGVAGKLAPFYHLSHPTKGSVPGPWARLGSPGTRRLALDVARVWSEWDEDGKLGEAVGGAVRGIGQEEMEYWERRRGPG